ncbi:MAG: amino acid permease [Planctomycetes bacterium]|nr:amino acid permease [Planctomycetota bacterium]
MSSNPFAAPGSDADAGFQRRIGLFDATMLIVGTMIGSGIFVVSRSICQEVGTAGWLMAVWVLAGAMTIMGALSYAELAAMMPHAGGQYVFLREAYSPLWGFLYGWTCFLVIQTGSIAAVAVVFARFLGVLVPFLGTSNIILRIEGVNLQLSLPWIEDPIFAMKDFTISMGQLVGVIVIIFLTALNCRGVQEGKVVQNLFTVAKTAALIGLIIVGLFLVHSAVAWQANTADLWDGIEETPAFQKVSSRMNVGWLAAALMVMGGAMVGALFSSDAWNNITFTAGEIRNPRRNLALSLILGPGIVIVLYLLANLAYLSALPVRGDRDLNRQVIALEAQIDQLKDSGQPEAAKEAAAKLEAVLKDATVLERGIAHARDERVATAVMELWRPNYGPFLMAIAVMISTFGSINGMVLMGARLYYVMARDNLFFQRVGVLNHRGVPAVGLCLQGIWSILLVFSGTYDDLLDFVIFAVLVFYVLTVAGLFILRHKLPDAERPYRAFAYPYMPALYVILCAAIMVDLLLVKPKFTWPGLIIVLTGIPVYFVWSSRGRTRPAGEPAAGGH